MLLLMMMTMFEELLLFLQRKRVHFLRIHEKAHRHRRKDDLSKRNL